MLLTTRARWLAGSATNIPDVQVGHVYCDDVDAVLAQSTDIRSSKYLKKRRFVFNLINQAVKQTDFGIHIAISMGFAR